jgi:hypothetical protein
MISLTCTNCQTVLTIDDAFAGGVCRCQHCGTIQTVPSHLKRKRAAAPGIPAQGQEDPQSGSGRTLYKQRSRPEPTSSTGLDALADVVSGSGISSGGLTSSRFAAPGTAKAPTTTAPPRQWVPIAAGAAIAVIAAAALIAWWMSGQANAPPPPPVAQVPTAPGTPEVIPTSPNFCGVALNEPVVIYVLDRGNATRDLFDLLKEATYKSIQTLGPERKFQVLFWNNGSDDGYPSGLPVYARPENLAACRRAMEETTAFGQSDATPALNKAIANKASVIVLATAKGLDLESDFVAQALAIRKSSSAKIHTFALGDSESPVLRELAQKTGAEYKTVSGALLRSYAD